MTPVQRMCKSCGRSIIIFNTAQTRCVKCQQARSKAKPAKPIAKAGKHTKAVNSAVAKWKKTQPSSHEGYWECYICHKQVPYLIAEHVKSKVRHRDLATDPNNLKPVCNECNFKKGSADYEA